MSQRVQIIVAGSGGVGKSAVTIQFLQGKFIEEYDPSIEDKYRKTIMIDDRSALLEILDTAGQEEFRKREEIHTKEGDGFLLVFSAISEESLKQAQKIHRNIIQEKDNKRFPVVLIGNKIDLFTENETLIKNAQKHLMKFLKTIEIVKVPENVEITVKARIVIVKGPRGTLKKNFKHTKLHLESNKEKKEVTVTLWLAKRKQVCGVRTIVAHIQNMINGVTKGYRYRMKLAYNHFPINLNIPENGSFIEIRNFLGEKIERKVRMLEGVKVFRSEKTKDEIYLEGNDVTLVSLCCAQIHQICNVRNKDIRMFLDGIYVSEKEFIEED
ncbi:60S ribosomal protein L9-RELATED [Anaeramoeba flamelloides]|uniref:60S ribosomal protein L9-RELATED n=2 Tax=Anaeramoeba flamelloides TaxID=1746091 RepID=A0AAV7ZNL9_9EUKA|nr:60S ribosomal protein L9-RELATED [Anaeramoeba flamelloides]